MLITITGRPGKGKTFTLVDIARKEFNKYNPPFRIWIKEKIFRKKHVYTINQYADFPIIFKPKKKNKIYYFYDEEGNVKGTEQIGALRFRIFDLILDNKFVDEASFYVDEIQAKYDSTEYKDFPDGIAHYCQAHRHFDNNIYCASQSQSRIIKRILVLSEEYWNIQEFRKIFGFGIMHIRVSWEMSANLENQQVNENITDVEYFRRFFRIKKVGNMYDSKYLRYLQSSARKYKSIPYDSLQLSKEELLYMFFPSKEEKEHLKNLRY